jgi:enoyl-CoA hydratase
MLRRLLGDAVATDMILFGRELDAAAAERAGLAIRAAADRDLVEHAVEMAAVAARAPQPLVARVKDTLDRLRGVADLADGVAIELEAQAWSSRQDFFREAIAGARETADGGQVELR